MMYKCVFCFCASVGKEGMGSVERVGRGCKGECRFQILAASNSTISVDRCVHTCTCFHLCAFVVW